MKDTQTILIIGAIAAIVLMSRPSQAQDINTDYYGTGPGPQPPIQTPPQQPQLTEEQQFLNAYFMPNPYAGNTNSSGWTAPDYLPNGTIPSIYYATFGAPNATITTAGIQYPVYAFAYNNCTADIIGQDYCLSVNGLTFNPNADPFKTLLVKMHHLFQDQYAEHQGVKNNTHVYYMPAFWEDFVTFHEVNMQSGGMSFGQALGKALNWLQNQGVITLPGQ